MRTSRNTRSRRTGFWQSQTGWQDGTWTVLSYFRPVLGEQEVWVEVRVEVALDHFWTVTHGVKVVVVNNPGYCNDKPIEQSYYKGDIGGLFGKQGERSRRNQLRQWSP